MRLNYETVILVRFHSNQILSMFLMRKTLLLLAMGAMGLMAQAAGYNSLSVHLKDGSHVDITLTDEFVLKFSESDLSATNGTDEISVQRSEISHFSHSTTSALTDVNAADGVTRYGNNLHFSGLPACSVQVFTVGGVEVLSGTAEGEYTLSLDNLPAGLYIATVNNVSYKVAVK